MKSTINQTDGKLYDDASGEVITLLELIVIGRSRDSAVPIPDPRVSRRHAMIRRQDDGFWYFDLGSVNCSLINGRRVTTSQLLTTGDTNHDEMAALLGVNEKTVRRHWELAKIWLYRAIEKKT